MERPLEFESAGAWERWLAGNHSESRGVWVRMFRKSSGVPTVGISDAVDVALCYGWITGQSRPYDGISWLDRFVPRRPGSIWSLINKEKAKRLIKEGRMMPAGLKQVNEAKRDGRWKRAYAPPSRAKVPQDFLAELKKNGKAAAFFGTLDRANVYALTFRLENTKNPELRAKKVRRFVEMFAKGEKFH